jgi:hypothetical protein
MVVRLHSSIHLLSLTPNHAYRPWSETETRPVNLLRLAELPCDCTEFDGRRAVDVAMDPTSWARVLVVDESGGVWLWSEAKVTVDSKLERRMSLWVPG